MFKANYNTISNKDKPIYIATKKNVIVDDYNNEIITYNTPIYLGRVNYQPLSGRDLQSYISAYGETKNKLVRAFFDLSYIDKIKEFDVVYLYNAKPINEKQNGDKANYKVKTFIQQNIKIMAIFEEIIKEDTNGTN